MAQKRLTDKQRKALELLTCGKGMKYKDIAAEVGVNVKTLYDWRNEPEYTLFQAELERIEEQRWLTLVDKARESASRLLDADNEKMTEFVLKNAGYNPTTKVEAEIKGDIEIIIDD